MNMNSLMAQAQKMQKDMERKQQEIQSSEYTGTSQLVDVVLSGDKKVKSVKIKAESLDSEDIEMLQDMIQIAINDAVSKIEKDVESKMGMYGKALGGLM